MGYLRFINVIILALCGFTNFLHAIHITRGGLIPTYESDKQYGAARTFIPYNFNAIIVGDNVVQGSVWLAQQHERANIFCFSSSQRDLERLNELREDLPNLHTCFGLLHSQSGFYPYYAVKFPGKDEDSSETLRLPGSLYPPILRTKGNRSLDLMFGEVQTMPTFSLTQFLQEQNLSRVHFFLLNCGGSELQILQSNPEIVKNGIIVCVNTYHQKIREKLPGFKRLDRFMIKCGFELLTHCICDDMMGYAIYVKSKYVSAVYRSKEF